MPDAVSSSLMLVDALMNEGIRGDEGSVLDSEDVEGG